jgi:hypothetical protein
MPPTLATMELVKALLGEVRPEEIAERAADGKAVCQIFDCKVSDPIMPEITVGYALVIVAYGSEISIERVKAALLSEAE